MTPQRWEQMQKIFEEALDVPDPGRRVLVHERCEGDTSLEVGVNRLLQANETTNGFLETPVVDLVGTLGSKNEVYSSRPAT